LGIEYLKFVLVPKLPDCPVWERTCFRSSASILKIHLCSLCSFPNSCLGTHLFWSSASILKILL